MATRQEQILMHLYEHVGEGNEYEMPFGTNQDGIAEAIGIRRGQTSVELKRLEDKGLVYHEFRHSFKDGHRTRQHRMCYALNPLGVKRARELLEKKGVA